MMRRLAILTFLIVCSSVTTYSQSDSLNQLDLDSKKTGWWITYLNEDLEVLKDSIGATHCMYNYYIKDNHTYRFGEGYGSKKHPVQFPDNDTLKHGNYTLLNGVYATKYKNGNVRSVLETSNGLLIEFKVYYPSGELKLTIVYSTTCGAPRKHCLRQYKKDGSVKYDGHTWVPHQ